MTDQARRLHPVRLGLALGTFLLIAYFGCLVLALIVPAGGLHQPWLQFLAGFTWTWPGILLGTVESFAYGFVSGVIFAPIYNWYDVDGSS